MAKPAPSGWILLALGCSTMAMLTSCAARVAAPVQQAQTAPAGSIKIGTIVRVRSVDPANDPNGVQPGFNAVMAALNEPAPKLSFTAKEYVIQLRDGNPVALVIRDPGANTGGAVPAEHFSVGDRVEIVEGAETELVHTN